MGTIDRVLFVRPKWDDQPVSGRFPYLMHYLHWIHGDLVGFANALGLDVVDLQIDSATRSNLEAQLASHDPALVVHGSHGGTNIITGQDGSELMCSPPEDCAEPDSACPSPNHALLAGRVMDTHSCKSATCLGPSAVGAGASAYIGSEPWLWIVLGSHPASYNCEEAFKSCWSGSPTELLAGRDSVAAHVEEIGRYDYWIDWYARNQESYPEAGDLIDFMNRDRGGWVHLGSPTTVTTKSRPAVGRLRCTAWGGSPEVPEELHIDVTVSGATHTTPFEIELGAGDYGFTCAGMSDTIRVWGGETTDLNLKLFTVGRLECSALYDSTEVAADVVITDVGTYTTPFGIDLPPGDYHLVGQYGEQTEERNFTIRAGETTSITLRFGVTAGPTAEVRNLAYPAEAVPGGPIPISFDLVNRGGMQGAMFAKIDGTELFRGDIPAEGTVPVSGQIPEMPPHDLGLTIEAGHSAEIVERRISWLIDDTTVYESTGENAPFLIVCVLSDADVHSGYRFRDMQVPRGALITFAELTLTTNKRWGPVDTMLYGEATGNAADFEDYNPLVTERPRTSASVRWYDPLPRSEGAEGISPNIGPIIQEIVNRPDWAPGNAIVIIHLATSGDTQWAWSSGGSPSQAPKLKIEYIP